MFEEKLKPRIPKRGMDTFKPPSEAFITPLSKSGEGTVRKVQISLPKNTDDTHPKYWQTILDSTLKRSVTTIKWDLCLDARVVQHMQINKCDTPK